MSDWPLPPYSQPTGPAGTDEEVVRAFVRHERAPHSDLLHVEDAVLRAQSDMGVCLRIGDDSFLLVTDLWDGIESLRDTIARVMTEEGLVLQDEQTPLATPVATMMLSNRISQWDLWGRDIDQAFADLRLAAVGGDEDMLGPGGSSLPPGF